MPRVLLKLKELYRMYRHVRNKPCSSGLIESLVGGPSGTLFQRGGAQGFVGRGIRGISTRGVPDWLPVDLPSVPRKHMFLTTIPVEHKIFLKHQDHDNCRKLLKQTPLQCPARVASREPKATATYGWATGLRGPRHPRGS